MRPTALHIADALGHTVADKRLDILRRIDAAGSISEAARGAQVSYKAAWQAIDTLSNLAGAPMLERTVGGSGGGGAQLTQAAHQLLRAAELLEVARSQVLAQLDGPSGGASSNLTALGLRTSMRNQLPCTVHSLKTQGGAMRVEMHLADGTPLRARITRESAQLLALRPGLAVLALFKATAVNIASVETTQHTGNQLEGTVTRATRTAGGEVAMELKCGLQLVGFASGGSPKKHGAVYACIEESAVVIALRG